MTRTTMKTWYQAQFLGSDGKGWYDIGASWDTAEEVEAYIAWKKRGGPDRTFTYRKIVRTLTEQVIE